MNFFETTYTKKLALYCLKLSSVVLLTFFSKIGKSQFHPSISPVLRSTNLITGDFIIRDDGRAVVTSSDMFVGIVDTITKEILYDTSYFRPTCPFGVNGFTKIIEHPKGGYLGAGVLDECDRGQAFLLWMDDTLAEMSTFLTPTGFEGTMPLFIDVAADEQLQKVYAYKRFDLPLWTTGKKPLILYTFTDSLSFVKTDTIAQDHYGAPLVDFNIDEGLMAVSYRTQGGNETVLNIIDLQSGAIIEADTFLYPTLIGGLHFFNDEIFTLQSEIISLTGSFYRIRNFLRVYDFTASKTKELKISGTESYMSGVNGVFSSNKNTLCLTYKKYSQFYNGTDTLLQTEGKAMFLNADLGIINEIDVALGPAYAPAQDPNAYGIYDLAPVTADDLFFYYKVSIWDSVSSQVVYYNNRISTEFVLQTDEIIPKDTQMSIYPNPAPNYINLSFSGLNPSSIQITDISGKVLLNVLYSPSIDISMLRAGTYVISSFDQTGRVLSSNLFIH